MPLQSKLSSKLKKIQPKLKAEKQSGPVWSGPMSSESNGGVTFSLISKFLCCRERFRIHTIEGIRPAEHFNHRIEYGNMWHVCEESLALHGNPITNNKLAASPWEKSLATYVVSLLHRYPMEQEQVSKWFNVCRVQFPIYINYWKKHADVKERTPLMQEQVFDVPYKLPSGRVVRLRGKFDSVDLIGKGKTAGIYLQENKSKGDIDENQIKRQLSYDLQTMMYLVVLSELTDNPGKFNGTTDEAMGKRILSILKSYNSGTIKGVRYNVIRRPLSGGRGTIVQHKPTKSNPKGESEADYYKRLGVIISENPSEFFARWKVEVSQNDILKFRGECLDPILEQLCDWYEFMESHREHPSYGGIWEFNKQHYRFPYGVYNAQLENNISEMDEYLYSGSKVGLTKVTTLFRELE